MNKAYEPGLDNLAGGLRHPWRLSYHQGVGFACILRVFLQRAPIKSPLFDDTERQALLGGHVEHGRGHCVSLDAAFGHQGKVILTLPLHVVVAQLEPQRLDDLNVGVLPCCMGLLGQGTHSDKVGGSIRDQISCDVRAQSQGELPQLIAVRILGLQRDDTAESDGAPTQDP